VPNAKCPLIIIIIIIFIFFALGCKGPRAKNKVCLKHVQKLEKLEVRLAVGKIKVFLNQNWVVSGL